MKPSDCARRLLLWDIDGTLITTGQAGVRAFNIAVERLLGTSVNLGEIMDFRGRTDTWISLELFKHFGLNADAGKIHELGEAYLVALKEQLPLHSGGVLPGILDILEQARQHPSCMNGLLTGNLERGAKIKLEHYDVWHYFEFGAFADDSHIRNELGPVALKRALKKTGCAFKPEEVYVIGDTPHDIACGKIIGARTIAVATGGFSVAELKRHQPTATFDDFSHPEKFFALLGL